jgi:hypothetical protein
VRTQIARDYIREVGLVFDEEYVHAGIV